MRALPRLATAAPCAVALALALASPAVAQPMGGDIPLDGFRPALDTRGFVALDGAEALPAGRPSFGLVTSWARGLLALDGDGAHYQVDHVVSPTLLAAIGLPGPLRAELAVALPFGVVAADRDPDSDGGTPADPTDDDHYRLGGQGVGDLGVHLKVRLGARGRLAVAGAVDLTLPTATDGVWLGSGATGGGARGIAEWRAGRLRLGANVGVRLRAGGDASFVDDGAMAGPPTGVAVTLGPAVTAGAAAAWQLAPGKLEALAELDALIPLRGDYRPIEARGALRVRLAEASHLTLGAGTGLAGDAGNPDLRAMLGIVFEPTPPRRARVVIPDPPPSPDAPRPGDRDDDGIVDTLDACPDEREDFDDFEDGDGCPDVDNDRDGILDVDDLCLDEPEDRDGIEDEDGCPETDADHDRIPDVDDRCPLDKEMWNTFEDDDGCPDRGRVAIGDGGLIVLDSIYFEFDSAVIQQRSHDILHVVAETLQLNPDLLLIEIGGHTDERGSAAYNLALSQRRADAVRQFLIDDGVDGDRLEAQGYGETRPLVAGHGERAWRTNRRVEFLIVRREGR
ncbi:MAG: OmpA family protein [Kofleriaceae bacterium]|nr:OmpA family protein [Kofleriaceae bacterium]